MCENFAWRPYKSSCLKGTWKPNERHRWFDRPALRACHVRKTRFWVLLLLTRLQSQPHIKGSWIVNSWTVFLPLPPMALSPLLPAYAVTTTPIDLQCSLRTHPKGHTDDGHRIESISPPKLISPRTPSSIITGTGSQRTPYTPLSERSFASSFTSPARRETFNSDALKSFPHQHRAPFHGSNYQKAYINKTKHMSLADQVNNWRTRAQLNGIKVAFDASKCDRLCGESEYMRIYLVSLHVFFVSCLLPSWFRQRLYSTSFFFETALSSPSGKENQNQQPIARHKIPACFSTPPPKRNRESIYARGAYTVPTRLLPFESVSFPFLASRTLRLHWISSSR